GWAGAADQAHRAWDARGAAESRRFAGQRKKPGGEPARGRGAGGTGASLTPRRRGLGARRLTKSFQVELLVEAGQTAVGREGEQLVGKVHEDAVVPGGVIGESPLELGG